MLWNNAGAGKIAQSALDFALSNGWKTTFNGTAKPAVFKEIDKITKETVLQYEDAFVVTATKTKRLKPVSSALNVTKKVVTSSADEVADVAKSGSNLVYQGVDKAGIVRYVGITEREAAVRFTEHLNSGTAKSLLQYRVVDGATGLTRTQARVWEQTLINQFGLQKNGGLLLNKINSITHKNWWLYGIKL